MTGSSALWGRPSTAGRLPSTHSHVCRAHLTQRSQAAHLRSVGRQPVRCSAETAETAEASSEQSSTAASGIKSLGPDLWNTTYYPKGSHADPNLKDWYVIDAAGQALGRLATHAATHIRGKHVPTFTNSMDMGSYVVVINAEQVAIGGRKYTDKMYYRVTGRPGAMKTESFAHLQKRIPERIVEQAIKGMLPKGRLGRRLFTHLKVYKGSKHPHTAQQPVDITTRINTKPSFQG